MRKTHESIGKFLVESLTLEQVSSLLDVLFSEQNINRFIDSFEKADPDMAGTVRKILKTGTRKIEKMSEAVNLNLASNQRIMEHWDSLWSKWNDLVAEVGDENGKYAQHEAHWEPAYFNGSALADDLEPIAGEMLSLIDDVYPLAGNPDLFSEALEEISDNISNYPEWMDIEDGEGCTLGRNAARCVMKWLWLSVQNDPKPGSALLNKVVDIEKKIDLVELDDQACADFFVTLPEETCREIYACLKSERLRYRVDSVHLKWHRILHHYEGKFDAAQYLVTCKRHLAENWHYGSPLIQDAINRGNPAEAEDYLEKTFSAFLRTGDEVRWYPEATLLKGEWYYQSAEEGKAISDLLEAWSKVSGDLGHPERSAAAKLQGVIFRSREDWKVVINEYWQLSGPKVGKVLDSLISQWKDEMARKSLGRGRSVNTADTWIYWLIEAELEPEKKTGLFREKIGKWLDRMNKDKTVFEKRWQELARLTRDLPNHDRIRKDYPTFFDVVLPVDSGDSVMKKNRCAALAKSGIDEHLSEIMKIWKNHLSLIIPDPAAAGKSEYTHHARWLKALYEINRGGYNRILSEWRRVHNRRRNLWRDIQALKLPL